MVDPATILHADLDAFYASVEQLLDPTLRGQPVAVGGGVVLAASYEAKAFGVRSGMPGWRAKQLCPGLVFAGGHFKEYSRLGDQVIEVLRDFTPLVERISIDEAFLDVSGATHLFGSPAHIAARIRARVREEIGLAVSIGVARTKHLAKIASQVAKPDGLVVVDPAGELEFLHPLPVELMWGVGAVTRTRLGDAGIRTIGDLAATRTDILQHLIGDAAGRKLGALATNDDPRRIETTHHAKSVGAQSALGRRTATDDLLRTTLGYLADRVAARMRAAGVAGHTVTVRVRLPRMRNVTRSITLSAPIATTLILTDIAVELARAALRDHEGEYEVTLLAVSVSHLVERSALQLELPVGLGDERFRPGTRRGAARWSVDLSVDAVRARYGRGAVGFAGVVFADASRVPEAFRELVEHTVDTDG